MTDTLACGDCTEARAGEVCNLQYESTQKYLRCPRGDFRPCEVREDCNSYIGSDKHFERSWCNKPIVDVDYPEGACIFTDWHEMGPGQFCLDDHDCKALEDESTFCNPHKGSPGHDSHFSGNRCVTWKTGTIPQGNPCLRDSDCAKGRTGKGFCNPPNGSSGHDPQFADHVCIAF